MTQRILQVLSRLRHGLRFAALGALRALLEVLDVTYMCLARCVDQLNRPCHDQPVCDVAPHDLPQGSVIPLAHYRHHSRVQGLPSR